MLEEFDIEIKDKNRIGNVLAHHLSRIDGTSDDNKELDIEDSFPDEQLFQVQIHLPWYADLVNYLACGIVPQEFTYHLKKKLRHKARFDIWDDPLLFRRGANQISKGVYLKMNNFKFWKNATQHSMKVILEDKGQLKRSSNLVSTGQHCLETVLNR